MDRVGGTRFTHDRFTTIDQVLPGAAVPMGKTREPEDAWAALVEHEVMRIVELPDEVGGVCVVVPAAAVERAAHVAADADAQVGPVVPLCDCVEAEWDRRRLGSLRILTSENCEATAKYAKNAKGDENYEMRLFFLAPLAVQFISFGHSIYEFVSVGWQAVILPVPEAAGH